MLLVQSSVDPARACVCTSISLDISYLTPRLQLHPFAELSLVRNDVIASSAGWRCIAIGGGAEMLLSAGKAPVIHVEFSACSLCGLGQIDGVKDLAEPGERLGLTFNPALLGHKTTFPAVSQQERT